MQEDDAEMVGRVPVEGATVDEEDLFAAQQVKDEALVVADVEALDVNFDEAVECAHRFGHGETGDGVDFLPGEVALFAQTSAGAGEVVDALVAAERSLDGVLCRHVGAEAHG